MEHKPGVIAITEVKPKHKWHSNINELQIQGYYMFSNDLYCVESREVLIYVDKCLDSSELSIGTKFKENIFIRINSDLDIGNIYRSSNSCHENNSELCDLIHLISNRFSKFIIVGDYRQDCRVAANCRYCFYSQAKNQVFRPAGATRCTDSGQTLQN